MSDSYACRRGCKFTTQYDGKWFKNNGSDDLIRIFYRLPAYILKYPPETLQPSILFLSRLLCYMVYIFIVSTQIFRSCGVTMLSRRPVSPYSGAQICLTTPTLVGDIYLFRLSTMQTEWALETRHLGASRYRHQIYQICSIPRAPRLGSQRFLRLHKISSQVF